jgi:hypothetical protein
VHKPCTAPPTFSSPQTEGPALQGPSQVERAGLEPATPSLQSQVAVIPGRAAMTRNDRD